MMVYVKFLVDVLKKWLHPDVLNINGFVNSVP